MKFRTIILTKKKLIISAVAFSTICGAVMAAVTMYPYEQYIPAFSQQDSNDADKENFADTVKNKIKDFLNIDGNNTEALINEYSEIFVLPTDNPSEYPTPAPAPSASPTPEPEQPPSPSPETVHTSEPTSAAAEKTNISSITQNKGISIKNSTSINADINKAANSAVPIELDQNGPQVLIMHTHTTESYYATTGKDRTTDENANTIAIGNILEDTLRNNGIEVIHDTTVHDYPAYNGSYTRALSTIQNNLEKYPSIKIVFDVHRDGMADSDGNRIKTLCNINGQSSAQAMLVVGTNDSGLSHPDWEKNFIFAANIQKNAVNLYPELMRPLQLREERFNQHLTAGSLILEIGSNGNSLEEAKICMSSLADAIVQTLKN